MMIAGFCGCRAIGRSTFEVVTVFLQSLWLRPWSLSSAIGAAVALVIFAIGTPSRRAVDRAQLDASARGV